MSEDISTEKRENPIGLQGVEFVYFTSLDGDYAHNIFKTLGFSKLMKHNERDLFYYRQNDIHFMLDYAETGFERAFAEQHGHSICAMGWRVNDAKFAYEEALRRGAQPFEPGKEGDKVFDIPAIYGIGDSLIYFIDDYTDRSYLSKVGFEALDSPEMVEDKGFNFVDHLTNNVYKGTMAYWADFYKKIFGFYEIRYFDIKGEKTGLTSFALKSPCGLFSIPINEGNESKSQIEEYLRDYRGTGVQHLALASEDLLASLDKLAGGIDTLDIDDEYYEEAFQRVPNVTEDRDHIKRHQVLIDGDEEGYLLQIFTKNLFGPIFFELIQRKNHHAFGEGNFTALFKSIERDQARRGVL